MLNWTPRALVRVPLGRVLLLAGGGLLALSTLLLTFVHRCGERHATSQQAFELSLAVVQEEPDCYYGSHWNVGGPVVIDHDGSDGARVEFSLRYPHVDGCWWESTEVLSPMAADQYRYSYTERVVSCARGATAYRACTRTGRVAVISIDQ